MSFKLFLLLFYVLFQLILLTDSSDSDKSQWNLSSTPFPIASTMRSMGRAITTSQVLTFNITNALILLIFKGILIGAGILGKISFWKYPNLGGVPQFRAMNANDTETADDVVANQLYYSLFSDEDKRWASAYIWAINKRDFGCLHRLACENRQSAQIYLYAGRFFSRTANSVLGALHVSYDRRFYDSILDGIQSAVNSDHKHCRTRFRCSGPFDNRQIITSLFNSIG